MGMLKSLRDLGISLLTDPETQSIGTQIVVAVENIENPPKFEMNFSEKATNVKLQVDGTGFLRGFTDSGLIIDADDQAGIDGRRSLGMGTGTPRIVRIEFWGAGDFWDLDYD